MSNDLDKLKGRLSSAIETRAARFKSASLFVKIALVAIFSAVAGVAQFAQFPATGPTAWQVIGILSSAVVAIGAIFVVITDQDASEELALAASAIDEVRDMRSEFEVLDELQADTERLIALFQAVTLMRGTIEQAANLKGVEEVGLANNLLAVSQRLLTIAMDFALSDQWTLAIYMAEPDPEEPGKAILRCIAAKRSIDYDLSNSRVWKEGTGIMGVAYSSGDELVIPDLQADGTRAVFSTSANPARDYDAQRYRSMVAVPILVAGLEKPWGVVTATIDRVAHFSPHAEDGVRNDEGARALAGMVALAIAVSRNTRAE